MKGGKAGAVGVSILWSLAAARPEDKCQPSWGPVPLWGVICLEYKPAQLYVFISIFYVTGELEFGRDHMQIKCARNCKTHIVVASDPASRGTVFPDQVRREEK